ncbi:hypothetical protein BH11CYA1_BH11CYA1_13280 [soil metagenome]
MSENKVDFGMFWQVGHRMIIGELGPIYTMTEEAKRESWLDLYLIYFVYPPPFAVLCTPLGLLPLKAAMGVFIAVQSVAVISASAIFAYSQAIKKSVAKFSLKEVLNPLLLATTFLPMAICLSIGQPGLLIGFLPITGAYAAMAKGRYLLAGAILGLLILKPQFLLPLALLGATCLAALAPQLLSKGRAPENPTAITLSELIKLIIGFVITASVLASIGLGFFGVDGYLQWLQRMRASVDFVYAHKGFEEYQEPFNLISSVPMAVAFQCPNAPPALLKSATSIFVLAASLVDIFLLYRIAKSSLSKRHKLDLTVVTAILSLPVISPYFRLYDLGLLVLPAWIIILGSPTSEEKRLKVAKLLTFAFWVFVDFRCLLIPQEMHAKIGWINAVFVAGVTVYALSVAFLLQPKITKTAVLEQ